MIEHNHDHSRQTYDAAQTPTWCPGCGNFAIWIALKKALTRLHIPPHKVLIVFGIGCSGNEANTIGGYGFHSLHGRAVPTAIGAKLANKDLTVIVAAGDGDSYGEGMGHFIHAVRGNVDITYLVHDNGVYGLTTGQAAPTAQAGFKAKSTPEGLIDTAVNPIALALSAGSSFVSRGFSARPDHLSDVIAAAIQHKGFSLVDMFQPCVTFNKVNTYESYYQRIYNLQEEAGYTSHDFQAAFAKALEHDKLPIGVFYQDTERKSYDEELDYLGGRSLVSRPVAKRDIARLYREFI